MKKSEESWAESICKWNETVGMLRGRTGFRAKARENAGPCKFKDYFKNECSALTVIPNAEYCKRCNFFKEV